MILCLLVYVGIAQKVLPKPNPARFVVDKTNTLSPGERQILEKKVKEINQYGFSQIVIVLIPTLNGAMLEDYATTLFNKWGIGQKDENNGVLILAAMKDRKIRIEVGSGLENKITDEIATSIIEDDITPAFRNKSYFDGLYSAVNDLHKASMQINTRENEINSLKAKSNEKDTNVTQQANNENESGGKTALAIVFLAFVCLIGFIRSLIRKIKTSSYSQPGENNGGVTIYNSNRYGGRPLFGYPRREYSNNSSSSSRSSYSGSGSSSYSDNSSDSSSSSDSESSSYGGGSSSGGGASGSW